MVFECVRKSVHVQKHASYELVLRQYENKTSKSVFILSISMESCDSCIGLPLCPPFFPWLAKSRAGEGSCDDRSICAMFS